MFKHKQKSFTLRLSNVTKRLIEREFTHYCENNVCKFAYFGKFKLLSCFVQLQTNFGCLNSILKFKVRFLYIVCNFMLLNAIFKRLCVFL